MVTASSPSIANRSVHSNVIVDTTPSSPRLGDIEKNASGSASSRVELVDLTAPVDQPEPCRLRLDVNSSDPPDDPVAVNPLTV